MEEFKGIERESYIALLQTLQYLRISEGQIRELLKEKKQLSERILSMQIHSAKKTETPKK